MATKNNTVSRPSAEEDRSKTKRPGQNPMIGDNPSDTIGGVVGALQWLSIADGEIEDELADSVRFGRYLLGLCCIDALKAAEDDLRRESATAKAKEEASHD